MKLLKTTTLVLAIIATFASCKKEGLNQNTTNKNGNSKSDIASFSSKALKMNFQGKQYEYNVSYDATKKSTDISGRDAQAVVDIINKYKEFVALFTSGNEYIFYKTKNDYYSKVFKNMIDSDAIHNRLTPKVISNQLSTTVTLKITSINLFQDVNYAGELLTNSTLGNFIASGGSPNVISPPALQTFNFYQPKNDGTDNYYQTSSAINTAGISNANVGSSANDKYSSLKTANVILNLENPSSGFIFSGALPNYNKVNVVLFEHQNFGGKAIAFNNLLTSVDIIAVPYLTQYRFYVGNVIGSINGVPVPINATNTWNDKVTSYQMFYSY